MTKKFTKFLKAQDVFGEPVTLNYNGESSYKTLLGALVTLILKSFILVFATTEIIGLISYKDPKITQVSFLFFILRHTSGFLADLGF